MILLVATLSGCIGDEPGPDADNAGIEEPETPDEPTDQDPAPPPPVEEDPEEPPEVVEEPPTPAAAPPALPPTAFSWASSEAWGDHAFLFRFDVGTANECDVEASLSGTQDGRRGLSYVRLTESDGTTHTNWTHAGHPPASVFAQGQKVAGMGSGSGGYWTPVPFEAMPLSGQIEVLLAGYNLEATGLDEDGNRSARIDLSCAAPLSLLEASHGSEVLIMIGAEADNLTTVNLNHAAAAGVAGSLELGGVLAADATGPAVFFGASIPGAGTGMRQATITSPDQEVTVEDGADPFEVAWHGGPGTYEVRFDRVEAGSSPPVLFALVAIDEPLPSADPGA